MKIIAAVSVDGAIGHDSKLLWNLSEDLKNYKKRTQGNICIVGLNTYDNLPLAALQGRTHIVVSGFTDGRTIAGPIEKNSRYELANKYFEDNSIREAIIYHRITIEDAIKTANEIKQNGQEIFIIGGAQLYESMIDLCDEAEITWINKMYPDANKRFPIEKLFRDFEITEDSNWVKNKNGIIYKFTNYKKYNDAKI